MLDASLPAIIMLTGKQFDGIGAAATISRVKSPCCRYRRMSSCRFSAVSLAKVALPNLQYGGAIRKYDFMIGFNAILANFNRIRLSSFNKNQYLHYELKIHIPANLSLCPCKPEQSEPPREYGTKTSVRDDGKKKDAQTADKSVY